MSELTTPQKKHAVEYALEYTKNLGNFENIKVRVGLVQEGYGHPDATMDKVANWVEDRLADRISAATDALGDSE